MFSIYVHTIKATDASWQSLKLVHQCDCANALLTLPPLITCLIGHPALFQDLAFYKLSSTDYNTQTTQIEFFFWFDVYLSRSYTSRLWWAMLVS